ncbi:MAG: hypothetical protein WC338_02065 [Candidatus Ratteibacteria bacterium]|jgi:hypothetical protein
MAARENYNAIGGIVFSPDSKHVAYWARIGNKECVVLDGQEGKYYDVYRFIGDERVFFDFSENIHYFAVQKGKLYFIEETIGKNTKK